MTWYQFSKATPRVQTSSPINARSDVTPLPDRDTSIHTLLDCNSSAMGDVWKYYTQPPCNVHSTTQRRRSRSSPVRTSKTKQNRKIRKRSPSVGSSRRTINREFHTRRPRSYIPEDFKGSYCSSESYSQTGQSYWCGSSEISCTAFFSHRPPVAPLHLVPIATPSPPPLPPPMYPAVKNVKLVLSSGKSWNDSTDIAIGILNELFKSLPTITPTASKTACSKHIGRAEIRNNQSAKPIQEHDEIRSIAVQAKDVDGDHSSRGKGESSLEPQNDRWIGGVRALRDSHVKLVLRQLRHINRLNRALDQVSRIPTPPSSTRSGSACKVQSLLTPKCT